MNEGQRTRNRIFALSSVKEDSITCHRSEIKIGVLDDGRVVVGCRLQDSFPIR
jgi:hypothetical protein